MSMVLCNECRKRVSDQAKACPHCGISPVVAARDYGAIVRAVLVFGALIWIATKLDSCGGAGSPTLAPAVSDALDAPRGACLLFIKRTLHDPGSADFEPATVTTKDGELWTVRRGVRAKNALGAFRLQTFECRIRERAGNFDLVSLKPID